VDDIASISDLPRLSASFQSYARTVSLDYHELEKSLWEMLRGDRSALGLAAFIRIYWTARVVVDTFYFSHTDWPEGRQFAIGHILLTSLFSSLATTYLGLFIWRVWLNK